MGDGPKSIKTPEVGIPDYAETGQGGSLGKTGKGGKGSITGDVEEIQGGKCGDSRQGRER